MKAELLEGAVQPLLLGGYDDGTGSISTGGANTAGCPSAVGNNGHCAHHGVEMVFSIIMKVIVRATEPEFVREIRPIAEMVLIAKRGPKLLKGG